MTKDALWDMIWITNGSISCPGFAKKGIGVQFDQRPLSEILLLSAISAIGLGSCVLIAGLGRRKAHVGREALGVLFSLALAFSLAFAFGVQPPYLIWFGLVGLWAASWLQSLRFARAWAESAVPFVGNRYAQACVLVLGGSGVLLAIASGLGEPGPATNQVVPQAADSARQRREPWTAMTDLGSSITLYPCTTSDLPSFSIEKESEFIRKAKLEFQVIRVGPPSLASNCHGWVFTGGQFSVGGEVVARVLDENGYAEVAAPQVGDLIIYGLPPGTSEIIHTGIVKLVAPDGLILIESKWSGFGRFLHRPADQPFSPHWKFYRSSRNGHLLRNLPQSPENLPSVSPRRAV